MKVTIDTNVLVRMVMEDDEVQFRAATDLFEKASLIAIATASFCELAWVLDHSYAIPRTRIIMAIRCFVETDKVIADRGAVELGLTMMASNGDFADGVIACEGRRLKGETFVSFDRKAVALLRAQGHAAELLR